MIVTNSSLIPRPESIVGWAPIMALNDSTDLAGLTPTNLANGFVIGLEADDKIEWWKLRALANGEVNTAGALVVTTADATRCWVRIG